MRSRLRALGLAAVLGGCSPGAAFVADPGLGDATPATAAALPAGARVVWTGVITAIAYRGGITRLQVLAFPPRWNGRPDRAAPATGAFRVRHAGYLAVGEWAAGSEITVAGRILGEEAGAPDGRPAIAADALHRWPAGGLGVLPFGLRLDFEIFELRPGRARAMRR